MAEIQLRDYQDRDIDRLRAAFARKHRSVLYTLPTGGGKTFVFSVIARSAAKRGNRVLILVHRQELLGQCSRSLLQLRVSHGLVAPRYTPTPEQVQVASVQTFAKRIERYRDLFDLVIIDEAHHATAGQWEKALESQGRARVLGVTATACRLDGQGLGSHCGGAFDHLVQGPGIDEMIADGYLVEPRVYAPPMQIDMKGVRKQGGDWARGEMAARIDKPQITGDAVKHYSRICPGRPAIAFCASVKHAEHVAGEFQAAGFRAASLDGRAGDSERKCMIEDLGAGRLDVLTSCEIISEGTDIPIVTAAILLRPTQSESLYLQQVGRVLRPIYPDGYDLSTREGRLEAIAASIKPRAIVLDHVGNTFQHGLPDEHREWTLEGRPRRKGRSEADDEPTLEIRQCPQCYCTHSPSPVCPQCGHKYKIQDRAPEQVDGELTEVKDHHKEAMRRKRRREEGRAASAGVEDLVRLGHERGYDKPVGWAVHRWMARNQGGDRKAAYREATRAYEKITMERSSREQAGREFERGQA